MNIEPIKILKEEFLKLDEANLMFITNPGRVGDEDGSTFVIKDGNEFIIYRIDGWMYPNRDKNEEYLITLEDTAKQFPGWYKEWKQNDKDKNKGKFHYLYMGFGNGLCIDKSIYNEFEPYLNELIEDDLENKDEEQTEDIKYIAIYKLWKKAFLNMINDKGYILKK